MRYYGREAPLAVRNVSIVNVLVTLYQYFSFLNKLRQDFLLIYS